MDLAFSFSVFRFILSCLLVTGGICCVVFGYRLFESGAGLMKSVDKFVIKNHEFNVSVSGMSAGAVLMLTSAVWGYFAYSSAPRLEADANSTKITQDPRPRPSEIATPRLLPDVPRIVGLSVTVGSEKRVVGTVSDVHYDAGDKRWKAVIMESGSDKTAKIDLDALSFSNGQISLSALAIQRADKSPGWLLDNVQ